MPPNSSTVATAGGKISLSSVLNNEAPAPYSLQDFTDFLKKEHSEENLEFWQSLVNYRKKALPYFARRTRQNSRSNIADGASSMASISSIQSSQGPEDLAPDVMETLKAELEIIVTLFLTPGSSKEVNLGDAVRKKVVRNIVERKICHPDVFKQAAEKIFELMRLDSFNRFVIQTNKEATKTGQPTLTVDREGGARNAINALQKQTQERSERAVAI